MRAGAFCAVVFWVAAALARVTGFRAAVFAADLLAAPDALLVLVWLALLD
jgi:hypothetical protein